MSSTFLDFFFLTLLTWRYLTWHAKDYIDKFETTGKTSKSINIILQSSYDIATLRYTALIIDIFIFFYIALIRCNIVLVRCNIVLVWCNIALIRCNIALVRCNIALVWCNIALIRCNIALVWCNIALVWFYSPSGENIEYILIIKLINQSNLLYIYNFVIKNVPLPE